MLNIPDSVKALFKLDSCRKNFRVHFPNGELSDLTNDNIVQESVRFTESLCSQDVFKFGLTEASVIEFETVGVANMYGMTIECACEIDCTSLTAAQIAEIEAGTWDGEYVALASSDLGYAFFRVPYGVFRVESCPRDHQAMTHRKVKAYTPTITSNMAISPYLAQKMQFKTHDPDYTIDAGLFAISNLAWYSPEVLEEAGFTIADAGYDYSVSSITYRNRMTLGTQSYFRASATTIRYRYQKTVDENETLIRKDGLLYNVIFTWDLNPARNYIRSLSGKYGKDVIGLDGPWYESLIKVAVHGPKIREASSYNFDGSVSTSFYEAEHSVYGLYLYGRADKLATTALSNYIEVMYPTEVMVEYTDDYGQTWTTVEGKIFVPMPQSCFQFEQVTPPSGYQSIPIGLKPTYDSGGKWKTYSFVDAVDFPDLLRGWLEVYSAFAIPRRLGGFKIVQLNNESPVPIYPDEYSQMWFDEYNVEPIGTISYAYTDYAGEEQLSDYQFGDGTSVYNMTDNDLLKTFGGANPSVVEALLDADFIPGIDVVSFVPIDLTMKGLPYIEAGDALSVAAQDGTICTSYALRQEITGVQTLEAQIDSQSGLIIDSKEATT